MFKKIMSFFTKEKKDRTAIGLKDMLTGDMVDYDMKTWEVISRNRYDWGGEDSYEWQLRSSDDMFYLEFGDEEEYEFSISRKIDINELDSEIFKEISSTDEAPEEIKYKDTKFYLSEISSGYFYEGCKGEGEPFVAYDYTSEDGNSYLTIEQWGERSFEASIGKDVEDYQFTNFLPGS